LSIKLNTNPYWWDAAEPTKLAETPVASSCDVVIVGAGYAGLSAALILARAGRSVQIFDKQRPGEGASSRNGGLASANIRMGLGEMVKKLGMETALRVYGEGKDAREGLAKFLKSEKIDCDYQPVGRFVGAYRPAHYEAQCRETEMLNKNLDIDAKTIPRAEQHKEIGSEYYHGGMVRSDLAGLHPGKFVMGLLNTVTKAGAVVHGETPVTGTIKNGKNYEVATSRGKVIAKQVIIATNGYSDTSNRWLQRRLVPIPSRIIATGPLPKETMDRLLPKRRMMGETRQLYHYYRPSPDGTRILFGGRERTWGGIGVDYSEKLRNDLAEIFPELATVSLSHTWSGYVAYNLDYMPRLFEHDGIHYATGFCGSGVVWAWWVGSKLAYKLIGDKKAATVFTCEPPKAVPFYSGAPWFLPAALLWFGLQDKFGVISKK
jgi:glycine/D-amino acid oxidase-like deaminating enzyme